MSGALAARTTDREQDKGRVDTTKVKSALNSRPAHLSAGLVLYATPACKVQLRSAYQSDSIHALLFGCSE